MAIHDVCEGSVTSQPVSQERRGEGKAMELLLDVVEPPQAASPISLSVIPISHASFLRNKYMNPKSKGGTLDLAT